MPTQHPKFRVAASRPRPCSSTSTRSIDKAIGLIAQAAGNGAKLIAFPETWLPGYPWFDLARLAGLGHAVHPALPRQLAGLRLAGGGAHREGRQGHTASGRHGLQRKGRRQPLHGRSGSSTPTATPWRTRRKLKPTHVERTVFGEGDGSDLAVYDTALGRIGALCCWEHLQPLSKYAMYAQNEQIHIAAWPSFSLYRGGAYALGPEVNNAASQLYAVEGPVLRARALRHRLQGDGRDAVHRPDEEAAAARGRRLRSHLRARRLAAGRAAARGPGGHRRTPTSTSA